MLKWIKIYETEELNVAVCFGFNRFVSLVKYHFNNVDSKNF